MQALMVTLNIAVCASERRNGRSRSLLTTLPSVLTRTRTCDDVCFAKYLNKKKMDLKDIIKWFIPCFHIFLRSSKFKFLFTLVYCWFLFLNSCTVAAQDNNVSEFKPRIFNKNYAKYNNNNNNINSELFNEQTTMEPRSKESARTFGRPMKQMMAALVPLAFQMGAASTWAMVAVALGVKTLLVTLLILKLLLLAGAAKFGSLLSHKTAEPHHGWSPPQQKEIHLHIHNNGHGQEHHSEWNRDGMVAVTTETELVNQQIIDPFMAGPQTIRTPFGNYAKITKR